MASSPLLSWRGIYSRCGLAQWDTPPRIFQASQTFSALPSFFHLETYLPALWLNFAEGSFAQCAGVQYCTIPWICGTSLTCIHPLYHHIGLWYGVKTGFQHMPWNSWRLVVLLIFFWSGIWINSVSSHRWKSLSTCSLWTCGGSHRGCLNGLVQEVLTCYCSTLGMDLHASFLQGRVHRWGLVVS